MKQHGLRRSPTYKTWDNMKRRCHSPNDISYPNYGGRGITVCERWRRDFRAFLADMGLKPEGMSIDRIDNDGNYEPGNCRWADRRQQSQNKRRAEIRTTELNMHVVYARIRNGWPRDMAFTAKKGTRLNSIFRVPFPTRKAA